MKTLAALALSMAAITAQAAPESLCRDCMRVLNIHVEQRKAESGSGAGAIGGAVVGGLLGNRLGGGTGRALMTVGGAAAGGYAGNEIEKNMHKYSVWVVDLKRADGTNRRRELRSDPHLRQGDVVVVQKDGRLVRRG
ncbi:glycine zipper 2TM domain-containing protein [Paucibacter sp. R3-3]|uniref:Glycine zipper 2TM domain-containing protein n=1 Tax=Roseateles agri TaxID=3098619 RepID=A0ABU5DFC7_9BURK|nr:glycine zipper 2TM domain-containing protein [Paucibacter sp. R3-3]MDY0744980.1 glycine zipper 2TM domain-containing protein [Paucibacter sp. R3-3]